MGAGTVLGMQAAANAIDGIFGIAMQGHNNKVGYEQQQKLQALQIKGNKEMTDYQKMKELEMWKATSYPAQMAMMKEAGLNPALMYGMGGGGGTTVGGGSGGVSGGNANMGGPVSVGMGVQAGAQLALMKAQKENIEADTANKRGDTGLKGAQTANVTVDSSNKWAENELKNLDITLSKETLWERINEIVSRSIEQQEKGLMAGMDKQVKEETIQARISEIKQEAINKGIMAEVMRAGIKVDEATVRKVTADIEQKWVELNQSQAKNEWEHHDRFKAIEDYTANALKVAGIVAVGNIVRDVTQIVTRKIPSARKSTTTTKDGVRETFTEYQK